jgi:hypothetical protein
LYQKDLKGRRFNPGRMCLDGHERTGSRSQGTSVRLPR